MLAEAHPVLLGEDVTTPWGRWSAVGSASLVAALTALRFVRRSAWNAAPRVLD
jgi:hypothetical protein